MADVAKWALLVAGIVVLIVLICSLPFVEFIDFNQFGQLISQLVSLCGDAFLFGRGLINNFLTPFGRAILSGIIMYLFGKFFVTMSIKLVSWIYHFIFK